MPALIVIGLLTFGMGHQLSATQNGDESKGALAQTQQFIGNGINRVRQAGDD